MKSELLINVCSILYGYPFDSSNFTKSPEDMPLIRIRDVKPGKTETFYKGFFPNEYIVHKGDFLIGMDGEFNIAAWQSADALLNQRVCKIHSCNDGVNINYIYRFLSRELKKIEDETPFVTVKHLSAKRLSKVSIPVPPREEQERIVEELDLLSGVIEKQKQQIKELDTLAQSIFYDTFGETVENNNVWPVKRLGEVGTFQRGGGFIKKDFKEKGFPSIHYGQIHTKFGVATYSHLTCIDRELALKKSKIAHHGDIVLAITSEDVEGSCKCTAWLGDYDVAVGSHAAIYRHTLNPIFASFFFRCEYFNKAKAVYAHGSKVVEIKPSEIASINVIIPPLSLQQEFAKKIELIEKQKEAINKSIKETQVLFDYTMDKYFG